DFALNRHGFRFVGHDTKVGSFFDEAEVRRMYYPEMEALVKAESGASRVVVFDHTLRTADDALREARKIREVVPRVHTDYTEWSDPQPTAAPGGRRTRPTRIRPRRPMPGRARASRSARSRSSDRDLIFLIFRARAAQTLDAGAALLALQPPLARGGGRARLAALA